MKPRSLKYNTIINFIRSILGILFPLITFKYASLILGPEGIGVVNYSMSVISYFQLMATFGIGTYAVAEGAKLRSNSSLFKSFSSEMFTLNLVTTLFALALLILFSIWGFFPDHNIYILSLGVTLIFTLIGVEWIFTVYEQFTYITLRLIIFQILSLVLLFIFVKDKNDLIVYLWLTIFATVGSNILNFYKSRKIFNYSLVPFKRVRQHIKPMFFIFGTSIASLIYVNSDIVLLGLIKDDFTVGLYAAGVKVVKALSVPIASVGLVSAPRIAETISLRNNAEIEKISSKVIAFMSFFIFPIIVGLYLMSDETILLLSGKEFLAGSLVIKLLILDIFLSPINGFLVAQLLIPYRKQRLAFLATIGGATINILLDLILIPFYSLYGAAIATVFAELVVLLICLPYIKRLFSLRLVFKDVWQYALASLPIIAVYSISKAFIGNVVLYSIFTVLISIVLYVATLLLIKNLVISEILQILRTKVKKK